MWLQGPAFLREDNLSTIFVGEHENFVLVSSDDKEIRPMVADNRTNVKKKVTFSRLAYNGTPTGPD